MFDRNSRKEVTLEASREVAKPKTMLKPRKVTSLSVGESYNNLCCRCVLEARGRRTRSPWTVSTSTRRSCTRPGTPRRTSSRWPPPTTCSCSRRTTEPPLIHSDCIILEPFTIFINLGTDSLARVILFTGELLLMKTFPRIS